ncbi:hypothetical protein OIU77_031230 [Salix suchowensis]|uniref:Uncharacterized protein n=1 Tax=Salix suchowensis TaxID=1278906 RepID=A0ABQ9BER7_9ROSI|nr:hypothetical protein OIU77_031230 [Salix suchowensis]
MKLFMIILKSTIANCAPPTR